MLQLREYQREANASIFSYWGEKPGNPLVVMATGTGKSLSMADLIRELLAGWPDMRIVSATHVAELIEQNFLELLGIWPDAPAGIFSAGIGRRDAHARVLFAGIQTVHNKAGYIGHRDVLLIDEAHLVPPNAETMYGRFIKALLDINPDMKIVGFTATPFRLDSGLLAGGDKAMFDDITFEYGIAEGIADGYLAPLSSKATDLTLDVKGVGKSGGDYKAGALQTAVNKVEVTRAAVAEILRKGADRKSWLSFCSGVEHALAVRDEMRAKGIATETVTGDTPKGERRDILAAFKAGEIRSVTNNSVLTTGFNHRGVDLIACLRPTLSASLYVQMLGRGTRTLYAPNMPMETAEQRRAAIAAGPKPNCLVLDFAKLVSTHGPVDRVEAKEPTKNEGEAPIKICPIDRADRTGRYGCEEICHASIMECPACGFLFDRSEEAKFTSAAHDVPVLSNAEPQWSEVASRRFRFHPPKIDGNPPSVKTTFMVGLTAVNHWLCPQHMEHPNERSRQFPKTKADRFWKRHGGQSPFPKTVDEWLERQGELVDTDAVRLDWGKSTKYPDVKDFRPGEGREQAEDAQAEGGGTYVSPRGSDVTGYDPDYEIPF